MDDKDQKLQEYCNWPETMPWPSAGDFVHQQWASACGSRFCLVGMVRNAFGLHARPLFNNPLPAEGVRFLKSLCENMGRPIREYTAQSTREWSYQTQTGASNAFEGACDYEGAGPVSAEDAARAFRKTVLQCGYTEDA
jgi:hypothetical protein